MALYATVVNEKYSKISIGENLVLKYWGTSYQKQKRWKKYYYFVLLWLNF